MYEIEVAVAKMARHGAAESASTVEMIERPHGGLSFVLADGRGEDRRARFASRLVARKATTLLGEGVGEGAAAMAANDYLVAHEGGEARCALDIVTLQPDQGRVVLARNSPAPLVVVTASGLDTYEDAAPLLGAVEGTSPVVRVLPLTGDTYVVVADEGVVQAGAGGSGPLSLRREVTAFFDIGGHGAQRLAAALLERAVELDGGQAAHDLSVLVLAVRARRPVDVARRLVVYVPLPA